MSLNDLYFEVSCTVLYYVFRTSITLLSRSIEYKIIYSNGHNLIHKYKI